MTAHKEELKAHGSLRNNKRRWTRTRHQPMRRPGKRGVATHCLFNSKACGYSNHAGQRQRVGRFVASIGSIRGLRCEGGLATVNRHLLDEFNRR